MIHAGDTIHNPVTGERLVFRQTSRETNGEAVVIETFVQPNGFVAAAHVHPSQEERFEVLRGSVGFRVGRRKLVAGPGKRLTVPAGTPHKFWNAGDEEAHFVCEIRPALLRGRESDKLWVTTKGTDMTQYMVYIRLRELTLRELGVAINVHMLRDCIAEAEKDKATDEYTEERLKELRDFFETTSSWYDQVRAWPTDAFIRFVNGVRGLNLESAAKLAEYLGLELRPRKAGE